MESPVSVVRVSTTMWKSHRSLSFKRTVSILKRKSISHAGNKINDWEVIQDSCDDDAILDIENFLDVDDGIYYLTVKDVFTDWETGIADGYSYTLVPYVEG